LKLTLDNRIVKYYIGYVGLIWIFIATQNYKYSGDLHLQKQVGLKPGIGIPGLIPGPMVCDV